MSQEMQQYLASQPTVLQNQKKQTFISDYAELKQIKAYLEDELQLYLSATPSDLHLHTRVEPVDEENTPKSQFPTIQKEVFSQL